jgi:hypothetical protein
MTSSSLRYILVDLNDQVFRLPQVKFDRLLSKHPRDVLPQFAGQRVRAAETIIELENRRPVGVLRIIFQYLHFDEQGHLDYEQYMRDGVSMMSPFVGCLKGDSELIRQKCELPECAQHGIIDGQVDHSTFLNASHLSRNVDLNIFG